MYHHNKRPIKPRPLYSSSVPRNVEKPKVKWRALPILWLALKRGAMTLGFLVIFSLIMSFIVLNSLVNDTKTVVLPSEMVLVLEFEGSINETPPQASFSSPFAQDNVTLRHYLSAIDAAKSDDRVKGIVARMREGSFDMAQIEEIRTALLDFKTSGKFTHIYSTSFGEAGNGLGRYYLASAFDQLWMQPLGIVMIAGMNAEVPYFRETLDKIGVQPEFFQRKEYKTAYESMTNTTMSAENREMLNTLVGDIRAHLVSGIANDRGMKPAQFEALVDKGLLTADEALESGLIDHMDYADVMIKKIKQDVTGDPEDESLALVELQDYVFGLDSEFDQSAHGLVEPSAHGSKSIAKLTPQSGVALIYAVGAIMTSDVNASSSVFMGGSVAASDTIAPAILDAAADPDIKAIVLRVDSPGGSPAASEAILRALDIAKEEGKPIIVSMGSTAASGGYWIAAHADYIFVSPTTITGSIGVVGGKFTMEELWEKLGVNWDSVSWGENSDMWSANSSFDEAGAERMNAMLDNVYDHFLKRVSKGRDMSIAEVDAIAKGRVWSGKRAIEVGLADAEGGLLAAIDHAAVRIGEQSRADVYVRIFPKPKTPLEQFIALFNGEGGFVGGADKFQSMIPSALKPVLQRYIMAQEPQNYMTYDAIELQ